MGGVERPRVCREARYPNRRVHAGEEPFFFPDGMGRGDAQEGGTKGVTSEVIEVVRILGAGERSKGRASPWVNLPGCVKVFWLKKGRQNHERFRALGGGEELKAARGRE